MKKLILSAVLLLLMFVTASSQWISNYSGTGTGDNNFVNSAGTSISVDNSGKCCVAGYAISPASGFDILTAKYDNDGDTLWTRTYNGTANADDRAFGIATDDAGNIYVTGTASYTGKSYDIVLLKYSSSGVLKWAKNYSGSNGNGEDKGQAIVIDNNGFIYVTGYCTDENNVLNMVTLKYNSSGTMLWAIKEGGHQTLESKGFGIAVDSDGKIDVTGYIMYAHGDGRNDALLVQYKSNGTRNWLRTYNNRNANGDERALGIAVDENDNVIITGYTTTSALSNYTDCLTMKYSSNGTLQWKKTFNGGANKEDKAFGIAMDNDGSVYIVGYTATIANRFDYVTVKYNSQGSQKWTSMYNGTGDGDDIAYAVAVIRNPNGHPKSIAVTGASIGVSQDYDFATVKYSVKNGNQEQVSRYSFNGNSNDIAVDVAAVNNEVFVTGYSEFKSDANNRSQSSVASTMMINMGESSELNTNDNTPNEFSLHQNYPNPFNPTTTIKFDINKSSFVKLVVYDILGRVVTTLVNQNMEKGSYNITFTANNIASGIYMYKLSAGEYYDVKIMTLVK